MTWRNHNSDPCMAEAPPPARSYSPMAHFGTGKTNSWEAGD